jgi:hypothetical protein
MLAWHPLHNANTYHVALEFEKGDSSMAYLTSIWDALCSGNPQLKFSYRSKDGNYPVSPGRAPNLTSKFSTIYTLLIIAMALTSFTVPTHAAAATLNVDGSEPNCSDSTGTPYCKIQAAIDAAAGGDTVLVAPGTYQENISFEGKAITVRSDQGAAATIIDGGATDTVAYFGNGETTTSVLDGFTLQNGLASSGPLANWGNGGGICITGASPTIKNNVITDNVADHPGLGIDIDDGSPIIEGNTIRNNRCSGDYTGGSGGGGIQIGGASTAQIINNTITNNSVLPCFSGGGGIEMFAAGAPIIRNNLITENASAYGGGIRMVNESNALIVQNIIRDNSATVEGGGIYWLVPSGPTGPIVVNNTIVNNISPSGSQVYAAGYDELTELTNNVIIDTLGQPAIHCGDLYDLNMPILNSNNIYSVSGTAYSGSCTDQTGSNGNISVDPLFVDASSFDYRLMPDSPVIGAGDSGDPNLPATDFAGNTRIEGSGVDIGSYEFHPNPGYLEFSASRFSAEEGDLSAIITVMRKAGRTGTVTVNITTTDASGSAGSDYTAVSETIIFNDGDMADKSVTVTILDDDVSESSVELVSLELSNPTGGATLGPTSTTELSIRDDDHAGLTAWYPEDSDIVCFIMTITQ